MELATRDQLPGRGEHVTVGSSSAEVAVDVSGHELVAAVPRHSVERPGLLEGDEVTVFVTATEVMLGKERS